MEKIKGIKSIDLLIEADGYGVVNANGTATLIGDNGKEVDNHTMPKLRGYTNLTGRVKEETGYKYKKQVNDIDFTKTPMYVSQNCIRHHLYKDCVAVDQYINTKKIKQMLLSEVGLVRGYMVPNAGFKRSSSLFMSDFVDQLGNGNYEQFVSSMAISSEVDKVTNEVIYNKSSTSLFSKTTFGETLYKAHASINIESLQFISLDQKFGRAAMVIKKGDGESLAQAMQDYIQSLDHSRSPSVTFHENYVRIGNELKIGEVGLLLDDVAIDIVVQTTIKRIQNLMFYQNDGWLKVSKVTVDYNDGQPLRCLFNPNMIELEKTGPYAIYYTAVENEDNN